MAGPLLGTHGWMGAMGWVGLGWVDARDQLRWIGWLARMACDFLFGEALPNFIARLQTVERGTSICDFMHPCIQL